MKKVVLHAAVAITAFSLHAQTMNPLQKITAKNNAGIAVRAGKGYKEATIKPGDLKKPVYLKTYLKGTDYFSYAGMYVGIHRRRGRMQPLGAVLYNKGYSRTKNILGTAYTLKASRKPGAQLFTWTYVPKKDWKGRIRVYFKGYTFGKGTVVKASVGKWTKSSDPNKPGKFYFTASVPVQFHKGKPFVLPFAMVAGIKPVKGSGYYNAYLSFYAVPEFHHHGLSWKTYGKGCGGAIGIKGKLAYGQKVYITLSKATPNAYGFLLMGFSNRKWLFFNLPLPLARFGAPGCYLNTGIFHVWLAKTDKAGNAAVPYLIPGSASRYFRPHFFQYTFQSKKNRMGLLWTQGGVIYKK